MKPWSLRPVEPERDFSKLAGWFTYLEDYINTVESLKKYYDEDKDRIIHMGVEGAEGALTGFYWVERDRIVPERHLVYLFVEPDHRSNGLGSRLFNDMLDRVYLVEGRVLRSNIRDDSPEGLAFFEHRGFHEVRHSIAMALDLKTFDDRPYDAIIEQLKKEGFLFTSMEELGNTEDAQRRLYELNDTAASETLGSSGEHPWESFEDFQKRVCQAEWYLPAGQKVIIDTGTGIWAGMSAITRFAGAKDAYNLFTGVDKRYRGRKLGQAVKVQALRFGRDVLKVDSVRTHHNTKNPPILAIDRKFGYVQIPGYFVMEKKL